MKIHRVYIKAENLTRDRNLLCHGSYHDDSTILELKPRVTKQTAARQLPFCVALEPNPWHR